MTEHNNNSEVADKETETGFLEDVHVNWRDYSIEDFVSFVIFWILGAVVFAQFFSRYVLNDSIAWTEEIARYLLIAVAFAGAPIAVRKNTHIHVEFFYRFINRRLGRFLSVLVDLIRIVFFAYGALISWKILKIMKAQYMTAVHVSMVWIYSLVFAGFLLMTFRAVQVAVKHWRQRYSSLDHKAEDNTLA